jgi:putative alpha-1,2-mannosidase
MKDSCQTAECPWIKDTHKEYASLFSLSLYWCVAKSLVKGSNADNVLSDSYVKGITAGINWSDGLAAMIKDATVTPPDWTVEGRGGIERRKTLHYVPVNDDTPGGIKARYALPDVLYFR